MAKDLSSLHSRAQNVAVGSDMESVLVMMHVMKEQMDSMQGMIKSRLESVTNLKDHMNDFEKFKEESLSI